MNYTLTTGKTIRIPDDEITKNMKILGISQDEAIQMYLEDNDYEINEEQAALDAKAKANVKVANLIGAKDVTKTKTQRERTKKEDPDKKYLIAIVRTLFEGNSKIENVVVENDTKIISFDMGGNNYKFNLTKTRKGKEG